jgi:hypothetical protein
MAAIAQIASDTLPAHFPPMKAQSSTAGNKVTKGGMWGSSSFAPTAMVTMAALANQLATGCWRSTRNPWFINISHQKKSGFTPLMLPKQMYQAQEIHSRRFAQGKTSLG